MNTLDTLRNFVILEELAHGGMGAVYVAYNPAARRLVAIKMLFKQTAKDPRYVQRFQWESSIYERLSHPNIVGYVDGGEVDGVYFVALEHVKGRPLDELLAKKGKYTWEEAVSIVGALADGMAHYHEKGIIHRDIKPQNVLVTPEGIVKLIDFGIAVASKDAANSDGAIVGTFNYASPEQNQGRKLDERSDLYSLGLTLHELITGKRVFGQSSLSEVSGEQLKGDTPFPSAVESTVPRGLDLITMKLIARDPNARYQKARELLTDFVLLKDNPDGFDPNAMFDDEGISAKWEQAKEALALKKFDEALRLVQVVAARKPDSAELLAFLGKAYAGTGSEDEAMQSFERAMTLEPENDQHKLDFGIALYGLKRYEKAAEVFQGILDLVPDNPYARRYLGLCEQARRAPAPSTQLPAGATPAGGTALPIGSQPGQVAKAAAEPPLSPLTPASGAGSVHRKAGPGPLVYLWWGAGWWKSGNRSRAAALTVLELAVLALIALPWTPAWGSLVTPPGGPLSSLFVTGGPLASAAAFKEWVVAGPAILLFLVLELVLPPKAKTAAQAAAN